VAPSGDRRCGDGHSDADWLYAAIELSKRCSPIDSAFCVGAILVSAFGQVIAQRYSRQSDPKDHAEEAVLADAAASGADLSSATLYTSLEPCLRRGSRPAPCAELILRSGVRRVVYAWREPPIFQPGGGAAWLEEHGVTVIELPDLAPAAEAVNLAVLAEHGHPPPR
jgi:diaminohydroxyphosphoribosylaminopyrimidine deaminase/5-amino-6-(5-phosphoribosylamino)uracil reductase